MNAILSPYVLIMITAAIVCIFIVAYVWPRYRSNSEAVPLVLLLLGITEWIIAALLGLVDQNLAHKILWAKVEYIGVVSVPLAVLGYVLYHSSSNQKLTLKRLVWLALIPVATLILAWTNEFHGLIWAKYIPYRENGLVLSDKTYGIGFWIYWVYSYLVLLIATVFSIRLSLVSPKLFRWQSILIVIGILMPWAGNLLYVLHINPFGNLDLTPLAFSITGIALAIGMFQWQLFDIKPIAQAAAIAGMADGLLILDSQNRIMDVNPAAQAILGLDLQEVVGKQMEQIITDWLPFSERPDRTNGKSMELKLKGGIENRDYEISDSPFYEKQGSPGGTIVFFHDATNRKRLEEKLREMERKHAETLLQQAEDKILALSKFPSEDPNPVLRFSRDGKILYANRASADLLKSVQSEVGQSIPEEWRGYLARALESGANIEFDIEVFDKLFACVLSPIQNADYVNIYCLDITERKQIEEELRESEERYQTLARISPVGIFRTDSNGATTYVNPKWCAISGLSFKEALGDGWLDAVHPDDKENLSKGWQQSTQLKKVSVADYRFVHPDGKIVWVMGQAVPEMNSENQIVGYVGTITDITDRKQAEKELRESEERFRSLYENTTIGIYRTTPDGQILLANPATIKMLGYSSFDELAQRNLEQEGYEPGYERSVFREKIENDGSVIGLETSWTRKDGTAIFVRESVTAIRDAQGKISFYEGTAEDITERKQAEDALRKSEARFRTLVEQVPAVTYVASIDEVSTTLYISPQIEKIVGVSPGEYLTDPDIWQRQLHPEDRGRVLEELHRSHETGDPFVSEYRMVSRDGRVIWIRDEASVVEDDAGKALFLQGLQFDITERKLAEEKLQESERTLKLFVEYAPAAIAMFDRDMKYIAASHRYIIDYRLPDENIIGRSHYEVFPEIPERWKEIHRRCLAGATETAEEDPFPRADGSTDWVRWEIHPWYRTGEIGGIILFSEVVTERKLAEQEIRQRTEDLILINALNEAVNRGEDVSGIIDTLARETRKAFACQDAAIYLLSRDAKSLELQNATLSQTIVDKIERLIGSTIPKVQIPIRENSYFKKILANNKGLITNDPETIQQWMQEFTNTPFLPQASRAPIRKIIPKIYELLNIHSVITIPLISSGHTIGLLDLSSKEQFSEADLDRIRNISSQVTAVILRKQAEQQVKLQLKRMRALNEIDRAIASSLDMRLSLDILLSEVLSQLSVDAASVLLLDGYSHSLEYIAGKGFYSSHIRHSRMRLGDGLAGKVGLERKSLHVPNLEEVASQFKRAELLKDEKFVEYFGVPLIAKGQLKGILEIFHRAPLEPDLEWVNYLETLGGQAAIAIDNAQLFEGMQHSNLELITAYDATIAGWSHAMDLRDKETEGHTLRVTELTLKLAEKMGISQQEQVHVRRGALLHDIGKLGVPDQILLKPGKLTDEEWVIMRQHPVYALNMLMSINYLRPALDIPYCHHEKWDGSGYPRGLKDEQIPLAARIFAVVDVWDALRSDRPYRASWSVEKTRAYILEQSGKHFDPKVVEAFLPLIENE